MIITEVIPSKVWQHKASGKTASLYGAAPWWQSAGGANNSENWAIVQKGWTWKVVDHRGTTTIGLGRPAMDSHADACDFMHEFNARQTGEPLDVRHSNPAAAEAGSIVAHARGRLDAARLAEKACRHEVAVTRRGSGEEAQAIRMLEIAEDQLDAAGVDLNDAEDAAEAINAAGGR